MGAMRIGARLGAEVNATPSCRAKRRPLKLSLKLVLTGAALFTVGLAGVQFTGVDSVNAKSNSTQLLVASFLAPALLTADVRVRDKTGEDVTGTLAEFLVANDFAESLETSPCGPLPSLTGEQGIDTAMAEVRANLPEPAYDSLAAAFAEWRRDHAAAAYHRILTDLPVDLATGAHCRVLHDIAADRLNRATHRWDEVKPRLNGAGM